MSTSGHLKFQGTNRATFVGETSNIMFDTTTTSLGIGVTGTDHPSSNLYITGNAYISNSISVGGVLTMGTVNVVARHDLEAVTAMGNTTPLTIEFSNATTGIVTTGNVEVGGELTVSGNATVSSNLTVSGNATVSSNLTVSGNATVSSNLTVSGNVEVSADTQVQEYPPGILSDYETYVPGHGVFCIKHSGHHSSGPILNAFNKKAPVGDFWYSDVNTYGGANNLYSGSDIAPNGVSGEWMYMTLPYHVDMKSLQITARNGEPNSGPKSGIIFGSADGGNTWDQVGSWSDKTSANHWLDGGVASPAFTISSTKLLNVIGFVVTHGQGSYAFTLGEIRFFGIPRPTTLDKDSLSLSRSLDVPRISRYDVDTETPRPEKLLVDFDTTVNSSPTDISGKGNHGAFGGSAYYSNADKAFILANNPAAVSSASTHYIRAELNNSETGNQYHSVSLWFKVLSGQNSSWRSIFECGENPRSGNSDISLYVPGGDDKLVFAHGGSSMYTDTLTNLYFQWHHVVLTYDGANRKIYLDGTLIKTQATTTWAGVANMTLHFGRNNHSNANEGCDCHISNFKLYWQTALEASEVQKLYRLGRTGRSTVITDTSIGIGKAPEAQLDVRGVVNVEGLLQINNLNARRVLIGYQKFENNGGTSWAATQTGWQNAWSVNYVRKKAGSQIYVTCDLCMAQAMGSNGTVSYRHIEGRLKVYDQVTDRYSNATRDWQRIDNSFHEYQRQSRIYYGPHTLPGAQAGWTVTVVAQVERSSGTGSLSSWGINIWSGRSVIEVYETMEA